MSRTKSIAIKLNKRYKEIIDTKAKMLNLNTSDYLLSLNKLIQLDKETIFNIKEFIKIELTLPRDYTLSIRISEDEKEQLFKNIEKIGNDISQADFLTSIGLLAEVDVKISTKIREEFLTE